MKQYRQKEYRGNGEHTYRYKKKYENKTDSYKKKTTYPWKNHQKSIRPT